MGYHGIGKGQDQGKANKIGLRLPREVGSRDRYRCSCRRGLNGWPRQHSTGKGRKGHGMVYIHIHTRRWGGVILSDLYFFNSCLLERRIADDDDGSRSEINFWNNGTVLSVDLLPFYFGFPLESCSCSSNSSSLWKCSNYSKSSTSSYSINSLHAKRV